jgi:hypothetical protein
MSLADKSEAQCPDLISHATGIGLGEGPVELLIDKALSGKASSVNWSVVEVKHLASSASKLMSC